MHEKVTRTRRRKVAAIGTALFLALVTAAAAYYIIGLIGSGSGSAKLGEASGTGTVNLTAELPEGLKPGQSGTVTFKATNPGSSSGVLHHLVYDGNYGPPSIDSTHAAAGCKSSWFSLTENSEPLAGVTGGMSGAVTIGAGQTVTLGTSLLTFEELPAVNQSACSGATITISLSST
jgi:hypothetical protein